MVDNTLLQQKKEDLTVSRFSAKEAQDKLDGELLFLLNNELDEADKRRAALAHIAFKQFQLAFSNYLRNIE